MAKRTVFGCLILVLSFFPSSAQTTEIIYQGQLQSSSALATGSFDFEFLLFDSLSGGTQLGPTLTRSGVPVANGIFSVKLDFGATFTGPSRFLEIHVRPAGGGAFTPLSPRQPVTSAPYSIKTLSADTATNAVNLGGVPAGQYLQTNGDGSGLTNLNAGSIATGTLSNGRLGQIPTANIADSAVTSPKIAIGQVVKSINTLKDDVTLAAGSNITITPAGNTLTIASAAGADAILNRQAPQQPNANFNISGNGVFGGNVGIGTTTTPDYRLDVQTGTGGAISGKSSSSSPIGVVGTATSPSVTYPMAHAAPAGVWGTSTTGTGVEGSSDSNYGVVGESSSAQGVVGTSESSYGVFGFTSSGTGGVLGSTSSGIVGVKGIAGGPSSNFGFAYVGKAAVWGTSAAYVGIFGTSDSNVGVVGVSQSNIGVLGRSLTGNAGYFDGTVVLGALGTGGSGNPLCRNSNNLISNCSSSLRYKSNVRSYAGGLDIINRLRPISFDWKQGGMHDVGLAAEEVDTIEPLLAFRNDKGEVEGVKYNQLSAVFINAFKEQQKQIEAQRKVIDAQTAQYAKMAIRLARLEKLERRRARRK